MVPLGVDEDVDAVVQYVGRHQAVVADAAEDLALVVAQLFVNLA